MLPKVFEKKLESLYTIKTFPDHFWLLLLRRARPKCHICRALVVTECARVTEPAARGAHHREQGLEMGVSRTQARGGVCQDGLRSVT